jgi:thiol-disulfide isomerase/thioredoxin
MRRWLMVGALGLSTLAAGCGPSPKPSSPAPVPAASTGAYAELPDVFVAPLDGELTSLRGVVKGKVAVIDLWATWCTACRPVSARVEKLRAAFDPNDVAVLGIDQGEEASVVARHQAGNPAGYAIYVDPTLSLSDALGVKSLPTVLVVDRAGRIRRIDHGVGPEVIALVEQLVAEGRPSKVPPEAANR